MVISFIQETLVHVHDHQQKLQYVKKEQYEDNPLQKKF